jgi:tRNA threonylcarbamoyladenosine biosynthesis protein TsaE
VSATPGRLAADDPPRRSRSAAETAGLGEALAPALEAGDVVALSGPLGGGKTCFVTGLAHGLEAKARVRSPSFTIVNEYRGRLPLIHLDLYRVETGDVAALGLEEQLERGALVVEWGEKLPGHLLREALSLRFEIASEAERVICASAARGRGLALLEAWRAHAAGAPGAA